MVRLNESTVGSKRSVYVCVGEGGKVKEINLDKRQRERDTVRGRKLTNDMVVKDENIPSRILKLALVIM
jgi:hypothetical protein